jgi:hypothetical protein
LVAANFNFPVICQPGEDYWMNLHIGIHSSKLGIALAIMQPSICVSGIVVGDDVHLILWESIGDIVASVDTGCWRVAQVSCVALFHGAVLCHSSRELFGLCHD